MLALRAASLDQFRASIAHVKLAGCVMLFGMTYESRPNEFVT